MTTVRLLALAIVVACAPYASAKETTTACATGDAELTDTRAIAAVRAAIDEACPCASAKGRGPYQRCARRALRTALDAGMARAECKALLAGVTRGATCGTHAVACGRTAGDGTPSCRVQAARTCKTRRHMQASACSGDTSCADVVVWTAGTCLDPRTPGPYAAGVQVIRFTKKSVVAPDTDRVLDTYVWYPALPGGTVNSGFQAVVDAPVDASGGPYPLLMFSHGSCGYPAQSPFLTALLATRGFIVVAPPHPGNTIAELPACMTGTALVASAQERPADIEFVLDQMLAANDDAGSPFHGLVDPDRLGMAGHSFGGYTVLATVPGEPRFKVAMPLAPAVPFGPPVLAVPSLFMIGEVDTFVDDAKVRGAYAAAHPPKEIVEVEHAGHFAFSQGCFTSPDCMPPTTLTQDEAHALVLRYAVPFLEVYLAGDDRFRPLLDAPAIPGVTVQAMR